MVKLFCLDDNDVCCSLCSSIGKHKNHNCVLISDLIDEKNKIVEKKIENLNIDVNNEIILEIEEKIKLIENNNKNNGKKD
jgi:DNA-binding transcriptional MerR regulator